MALQKDWSSSKRVLVDGAVRPWHVLFLYSVCFATSVIAGYYLTKGQDTAYQREAWEVTMHALSSVMILALTLIVPEFRRALPILFSHGVVKPRTGDLALAAVLGLCWGYGLYRFAFCFPALLVKPEWFRALHFADAVRPFEPKHLALLFGSLIAAPLGEELVFRGFLLNLWIRRWGIWPAVILSSLAFGFFHWERALFATVLGGISALVYLKYDTLWPAILLHALYNLLAQEWLIGGLFYAKPFATIGQISSWIPELILSLLFIPLAVLFWRRFRPETS